MISQIEAREFEKDFFVSVERMLECAMSGECDEVKSIGDEIKELVEMLQSRVGEVRR